jgi:hypothetical protein
VDECKPLHRGLGGGAGERARAGGAHEAPDLRRKGRATGQVNYSCRGFLSGLDSNVLEAHAMVRRDSRGVGGQGNCACEFETLP